MWKGLPLGIEWVREGVGAPTGLTEREKHTESGGIISLWMLSKSVNMLSAFNLGDTNPRGHSEKTARGVQQFLTPHLVPFLPLKIRLF